MVVTQTRVPTLRDDSQGKSRLRREVVCVSGFYICVCKWVAGVACNQSQVWGTMGIWVQQGNTNIRETEPSGGAEEAVREPPL